MVSPTAATFYFYKSFWSVLRSQALETLQPGLHQSLPDLLWNLLRNPVEHDLALHQTLPDLLRNLLRNPVASDLALHQSLPDLHRNLLRNAVELDLLCTKAFSGTFSGTLLSLTCLCTKASPQTFRPSPEPSLEPCWTWPGSAPKPFEGFSGTSLNLTRRLQQCTPDLFWAENPISLCCWGKKYLDQFKIWSNQMVRTYRLIDR